MHKKQKAQKCVCMGTGRIQVKSPGISEHYTTVACPDCSPNSEYENARSMIWHPHFENGDI